MTIVCLTGGGRDPKKCHKSKSGKCNRCRTKLVPEYGCCDYGIGIFERCLKCYRIYNFTQDHSYDD